MVINLNSIKPFSILVIMIVLSITINAQTTITIQNEFPINKEESFLTVNSFHLVYNSEALSFNGNIVFKQSDRKIFSILNSGDSSSDKFMVFTVDKKQGKIDKELRVHQFDHRQPVGLPWSVPIYYDSSIPVPIIKQNRIIFLRPETQSYSSYDLYGENQFHFNLVKDIKWNHEMVLQYLSNDHAQYLVGMESADLLNRENTVLYQLDDEMKAIRLGSLPITIPYKSSITNDQFAIIGTRAEKIISDQIPYLLISNLGILNAITEIPLDGIPREIIWHTNNIYLIYKDHYVTATKMNNYRLEPKYFNHPFYAVNSFAINQYLYFLGARGFNVSRTAIEYSDIELIELSVNSKSMSTYSLYDGSTSKIQLKKGKGQNEYFLTTDNRVIQFKIEH